MAMSQLTSFETEYRNRLRDEARDLQRRIDQIGPELATARLDCEILRVYSSMASWLTVAGGALLGGAKYCPDPSMAVGAGFMTLAIAVSLNGLALFITRRKHRA